MISKEMKSIIRCFYRTIKKRGLENNEVIKFGCKTNLNLKYYKVYEWSCVNPNFPDFFSGGSHGKYNSLRDTLLLVSKEPHKKYDDTDLRLVTLGIYNNLYKSIERK